MILAHDHNVYYKWNAFSYFYALPSIMCKFDVCSFPVQCGGSLIFFVLPLGVCPLGVSISGEINTSKGCPKGTTVITSFVTFYTLWGPGAPNDAACRRIPGVLTIKIVHTYCMLVNRHSAAGSMVSVYAWMDVHHRLDISHRLLASVWPQIHIKWS